MAGSILKLMLHYATIRRTFATPRQQRLFCLFYNMLAKTADSRIVANCGTNQVTPAAKTQHRLDYQRLANHGTKPAIKRSRHLNHHMKTMKALAQNLKQAIDALEFSNANHLHGLTTKLSTLEKLSTLDRSTPPIRPGHDSNHPDDSFGSIAGAATASR